MATDRITMTVPARGEYARTVRLTAAQLASRIGMSYDEVDDVRLAAEEAFIYACDNNDESGEVRFVFEVAPASLSISVGPVPCGCGPDETPAIDASYAGFILNSVCDEFSVEHEGGACMLHIVRHLADPSGGIGA
jgi:serine/threonine-protein kinase RsbW